MTDDIRPTPEFRAELEELIIDAWRQEGRYAAPRRRSRGWLRAAAVILASLGVGAVSGLASAQVRASATRDSLAQAAMADLDLLHLRLRIAQAALDDARSKVAAGVLANEELTRREVEMRIMQARVQRLQINLDEIAATKLPPRDELNAPLVGKRDFVRERIELDIGTIQEEMRLAEERMRRAARMAEAGTLAQAARLDADVEFVEARTALQVAARRLELRKQFLDGKTSMEEMARQLELAKTNADIEVAMKGLEAAKNRLDRAAQLRANGGITEVDLLRAQLDQKERELELQKRVEMLKRLKAGRDTT